MYQKFVTKHFVRLTAILDVCHSRLSRGCACLYEPAEKYGCTIMNFLRTIALRQGTVGKIILKGMGKSVI